MSVSSSCSSPANSASPSFSSEPHSRRASTPWSTQSSLSGSGFYCPKDDRTAPYWLEHQPSAASLSQLAMVPYPYPFDWTGDHQGDPWSCSRLQSVQPASPAPSTGNALQQTNAMFDPSTALVLYKSASPQTSTSMSASPSDNCLGARDDALCTAVSQPSLEHSAVTSPLGTTEAASGAQIQDGLVPPATYHLEPKFPPHPAYLKALEFKDPPPVIYEKLKGPWQKTEDEALVFWAIRLGTSKWVDVAARVGSRTGKQCRERWTNQLSPEIDHSPFRPDEDDLIIRMQAAMDGNRWREVAKYLPGRPENTIKNRFNSTVVQRKRAGLHSQGPPLIATPMLFSQKRRKSDTEHEKASASHPTKKIRMSSIPLSIMAPEQPYSQAATSHQRRSVTFPTTPVTPGFAQPTTLTSWSSTSWEGPSHPLHTLSASADYPHLTSYQAYSYGANSGKGARRGYYPTQYGMMGGGTGGYLTPSSQYPTADFTPPATIDPQAAYSDYSHVYSNLSETRPSSSQELYQYTNANEYGRQNSDTISGVGSMSSMPTQSSNTSLQLEVYRPAITYEGHAPSRHGSRVGSPTARYVSWASSALSSTSTASQSGSTPLIGLGISMGSLDAGSTSSSHSQPIKFETD